MYPRRKGDCMESIDYIKNHDILEEIYKERIRQHGLWGTQKHPIAVWQSILLEEIGEVARAINERMLENGDDKTLENLREEIIQVAAVAVAMVESLDINDFDGSEG